MPQLDEYLRQLAPSMTQWRRDFHLHAESGWLEFRTASMVADILDGLGYQLALGRDVIDADSRMGLPDEETLAQAFERAREQGAPERWLPAFEGGFAGVVATLDTGRPGPTLAFRVDMDALDLNEQHDDSHRPHRDHFASCNAGMMHACGHDGHTAIGLGLAHVLKQYAAQLNGVIKLIFQPAEEGTRGARAMVAAGVVDDVDYFTAIHIGTGVQQAVDRIAAPAGSEDATLMMARVQARGGLASYMIFGTELSAGHHNEKFDFDESVMAVAVETLARVALNFPWQRGV
ncbi:TPA: amidohydrolase [Klebsiella pneumoniae]|nr:amidohydrolase [Klebsiella pneumoniae]